jgi:hypothetical protein
MASDVLGFGRRLERCTHLPGRLPTDRCGTCIRRLALMLDLGFNLCGRLTHTHVQAIATALFAMLFSIFFYFQMYPLYAALRRPFPYILRLLIALPPIVYLTGAVFLLVLEAVLDRAAYRMLQYILYSVCAMVYGLLLLGSFWSLRSQLLPYLKTISEHGTAPRLQGTAAARTPQPQFVFLTAPASSPTHAQQLLTPTSPGAFVSPRQRSQNEVDAAHASLRTVACFMLGFEPVLLVHALVYLYFGVREFSEKGDAIWEEPSTRNDPHVYNLTRSLPGYVRLFARLHCLSCSRPFACVFACAASIHYHWYGVLVLAGATH